MKKKAKVFYTNEVLSKKFGNSFDLVNHAILLAENMILSGRDSRVKLDVQNRAMHILAEIQEGKDHFEEIKDPATRSAQQQIHSENTGEGRSEKRKYRSSDVMDD